MLMGYNTRACFCRRVLQLEGQLASLQEETQLRQTEMQATIDTLRQDKRTLEAQAAGVNLHAVEAGDPLVLQVWFQLCCSWWQQHSCFCDVGSRRT